MLIASALLLTYSVAVLTRLQAGCERGGNAVTALSSAGRDGAGIRDAASVRGGYMQGVEGQHTA